MMGRVVEIQRKNKCAERKGLRRCRVRRWLVYGRGDASPIRVTRCHALRIMSRYPVPKSLKTRKAKRELHLQILFVFQTSKSKRRRLLQPAFTTNQTTARVQRRREMYNVETRETPNHIHAFRVRNFTKGIEVSKTASV